MPPRDLNVLHASECAAKKVNDLLDGSSGRRMLHVNQLRNSVQSIGANIAEGLAKGPMEIEHVCSELRVVKPKNRSGI